MALVRDDAGRIHGLLTLEDVLEEIVGDIEDEHDAEVPRLKLASLRRRRARMPVPLKVVPEGAPRPQSGNVVPPAATEGPASPATGT
jgi:hypothetical protein